VNRPTRFVNYWLYKAWEHSLFLVESSNATRVARSSRPKHYESVWGALEHIVDLVNWQNSY
jgi:hypothetical protein